MKHNPFTRGQDGKFIGCGASIAEWTGPLLSSGARVESCPCELLEHAARWCEQKAAQRYKWAGEAIVDYCYTSQNQRERMASRHSIEASQWLRRAAFLRERAEKLKEVR